jgi:sporulation protein YpjB
MFIITGYRWFSIVMLTLIMILIVSGCGNSQQVSTPQKHKVTPQQLQKVEFLNQTADEMYKKAMEGQMMEARSKLLQISDQITGLNFEGIVSLEGLHALTESVTQAKRVYNAVSFSHNEGQIAAAKIRLATDALTHANQPMWLQYEKLLHSELDLIDQAIKASKRQDALTNFSKLNQHIAIIHPSLLINRNETDVEKLDSLLVFLKTELNKDPMAGNNVQSGIEQLHQVLDDLFKGKQEATAYLAMPDAKHPILWAISIGAIISSVLTFAGWRMFRSKQDWVAVNKKEEG